jgi:hypothetical protein
MSEISIGEAMQLFLKKSRLKTGIQAIQIEEVWEQLMGVTIAKYTDKIQIIGSTLFVHTQVAPLRNELLFQKENIIARVNEIFGDKVIKEVIVK